MSSCFTVSSDCNMPSEFQVSWLAQATKRFPETQPESQQKNLLGSCHIFLRPEWLSQSEVTPQDDRMMDPALH